MSNLYPTFGDKILVPAADLASATAPINVVNDAGGTRKGGTSCGKSLGMEVMVDAGSTVYKLYFALGNTATSKWQLCDGSAQVTPS